MLHRLRSAPPARWLCLLALLAGLVPALWHFWARLAYEAAGPYTWDTPLYWAVGRGILNGITPWSGLFETKPPGIFMLSALSWSLGSSLLCHLAQILALLCLALTPLALLAGQPAGPARLLRGSGLLLAGLLLAQYVAERSGEVQVESFGAAASALVVLGMASPWLARHRRSALLLTTLGFLGACGMKEPFIAPLLGAAFLLLDSWQAWWQRFILPLLLAMLLGGAVLLCMGWLDAYVHDYLGYMLGNYAGRSGSPWNRALHIWRMWDDMNAFAWGLGYALVLAALGCTLRRALRADDQHAALLAFLRLGAAALLAAFAVGLGGEYYNHHHVFLIPLALAVLALAVRESAHSPASHGLQAGTAAVITLLLLATLALPRLDLPRRLEHLQTERQRAVAAASYVDAVLDASPGARYLFIGGNGPQIYGFTHHSPLGPLFFQLPDIVDHSKRLRESYLENLHQADLLVVEHILPTLEPETRAVLAGDFSREPWPHVAHLARPAPRGEIWFRKNPGSIP